jgi:hypothetical protein
MTVHSAKHLIPLNDIEASPSVSGKNNFVPSASSLRLEE